MRKLLGMGMLLTALPCAAFANMERAQQEDGEQTFVCWRYDPDIAQGWQMRSITVEAHTAREAIAACADAVRDELRRQNRRIVRT